MGRASTLSLCLKDKLVSKKHLLIEMIDGVLFITDLGSRNGTDLQRKPISPNTKTRVQDGDEIELGAHLIRVTLTEDEAIDDPSLLDATQTIALLPTSEFTIHRKLGRGAYGTVYLAEQKLLRRLVAIKVLHHHLMSKPFEREAFIIEARTCAAVESPYVVKVIDIKEIHGKIYLIMEYVNGSSALELMNKKVLTLQKVITIADHISHALQALLDAGVVHRDIKPGNILVDQMGTAKLADFGIAKPMIRANALMLPPIGEGVGSLWYVAPEQAYDGRNATEHSDIYSLGASMYHMISGKPAIHIRHPDNLRHKLKEVPVPLINRVKNCPKQLSVLIERMLAKDPMARPSGPGAIISALHEIKVHIAMHENPIDDRVDKGSRATVETRRYLER